MLGLGLAEVSLEGEGIGGGNTLSGSKAGGHFGQAPILPSDGHLARLKAIGRADEHDGIALEVLQRCFRHYECCRCCIRGNVTGDEGTRPPFERGVID